MLKYKSEVIFVSNNKMMKVYSAVCSVIAVAYGLWMAVFMSWDQYPYIIPTEADALLPAEEFIAKFDGMLYMPLYPNALVFWLWVVASTALIFCYALFIR